MLSSFLRWRRNWYSFSFLPESWIMKLNKLSHFCNCKGGREFKWFGWIFNWFDLCFSRFFSRCFLFSLIYNLFRRSLHDLLLCFFLRSLWCFNRVWNRLCDWLRWSSCNFCFWRSCNSLASSRFLFIFFRWWFNYNFCLWFLNWSRFCLLLWCRYRFLSTSISSTPVGVNNRGCNLDFLVYFQTLFDLSFRGLILNRLSISYDLIFLVRIIDLSSIS